MTREQMLQNYDALIKILGQEGASEQAAEKSLNFYLKIQQVLTVRLKDLL